MSSFSSPAYPQSSSLTMMWNRFRKQRVVLPLALSAAFIFFFCSGDKNIPQRVTSRISSIQTPFMAWTNMLYGQEDHNDDASRLADAFAQGQVQSTTYVTETTLPGNQFAEGFTIFDRLYVRNGTFFVVTSNPAAFPKPKSMIAQPGDLGGPKNMDPTERELQIISPEQAKAILGGRAVVIGGVSVILYDTKQFLTHYYHWWGEVILGVMRMYASLPFSARSGEQMNPLYQPWRFIIPNVEGYSWRDRPGVNGPLMRAGFPHAPIETKDFWQDLIELERTFVFERAVLVNRIAAHTSPLLGEWFKMISSTMNVTVPPLFWEPLRQKVVRNTIGTLPVMDQTGAVISPAGLRSAGPVVTYISRQATKRRLASEAHDRLVSDLLQLEEEGLCEVDIVQMETMSFVQQIEVAARTTIMIGVHGNGLTHQLWMPPSRRSTVMEMLFPNCYLHDYEILARNMGHKHYAIWNDTAVTYPSGQWFKGVQTSSQCLSGSSTPVHGPTVVQIIRDRLAQDTPWP